MSREEGEFTLSTNKYNQCELGVNEHGMWVARRLKPGMRSVLAGADWSLDRLMAKCEQNGLVMVDLSEAAQEEIDIHIHNTKGPVLDWLKATFPKHFHEEGPTRRGPLGFRLP